MRRSPLIAIDYRFCGLGKKANQCRIGGEREPREHARQPARCLPLGAPERWIRSPEFSPRAWAKLTASLRDSETSKDAISTAAEIDREKGSVQG